MDLNRDVFPHPERPVIRMLLNCLNSKFKFLIKILLLLGTDKFKSSILLEDSKLEHLP